MVRSLIALVMAAPGLLLPALVTQPGPADAAEPRTCDGRLVTIDLHDADAPSPNRAASDVVIGTRRGQIIATGGGDDIICAGPGDDFVSPGPGNDVVIGGGGSDVVEFQGAPRAITVDLRITGPQTTGWGDDTVRNIEGVFGAYDFPNYIRGNSRDNNFIGGDAADDIRGNGGDDDISDSIGEGGDLLRGGTGNDEIHGGDGDDLLAGGPGHDYLCGGADLDVLYGGPGDDLVYACQGVVGERESVFGGPGDDQLTANESDELLAGGDGFDLVTFRNFDQAPGPGLTVDLAVTGFQDTTYSGSDKLTGVEGLVGTSRDDDLHGDDGPNYLRGGAGADTVDGRGGTDECVYDPADVYAGCEKLVDSPY